MSTINTKNSGSQRHVIVLLACLLCVLPVVGISAAELTSKKTTLVSSPAPLDYELKQEVMLPASKHGGWFQPRPTPVPGYGRDGGTAVVMTIQKAMGSDFFTGLSHMRTDDMGLN